MVGRSTPEKVTLFFFRVVYRKVNKRWEKLRLFSMKIDEKISEIGEKENQN